MFGVDEAESLKQSIIDAYMRGFRHAIHKGGDPSGSNFGPYKKGYQAGKLVLLMTEQNAQEHADRVLASPAMKQARENAKVGS